MRQPYYDQRTNSVFYKGALNPVNPDTGEAWAGQEEAETWIAALPTDVPKPFRLTLVATAARYAAGDDVPIQQPFNLITVDFGQAVEVDVEVQDGNGGLVSHVPDGQGGFAPLTQTFVLPVPGLYGTPMEVVTVDFVEGKATATVTFPAPGMWRIGQEEVNRHIAYTEQYFAFAGLEFKAKRPAV